jgi:hypothetical protein
MTQKIFDTDNAEDMALLWSILPDDVCNIEKWRDNHLKGIDEGELFYCDVIEINWHYKTEITRPIHEATEADLGKLCTFWDNEYNPNAKIVGCLCTILPFNNFKYTARGGLNYRHCRRLTKNEIEELC